MVFGRSATRAVAIWRAAGRNVWLLFGGEIVRKFDHLTVLKKTKARAAHLCSECSADISPGEHYYKEHIQDRFLHSLHAKKFCVHCFEKHGEALLNRTS